MLARQLADQLVDGLVISPLDPSSDSWEEIGEVLPIVTVGDALAGPTVGEVLFDNRTGVGMVLEHLHALGHRRIAVLTPSRPSTPDRPAERVVAEVCAALGMDAAVVNTRHSIEDATEAAAALLRARPAPDRGVLPVGLDRLRRLRGRGRRAGSRSRATSPSPATTTTRSRACRAGADERGLGPAGRRDRRRGPARRGGRGPPQGARPRPGARLAVARRARIDGARRLTPMSRSGGRGL